MTRIIPRIGVLFLPLLLVASSALTDFPPATPEGYVVVMHFRIPIAITEVNGLDFGLIDVPAVPTTFTVTPTSGAQPGAGIGANAAEFAITGEAPFSAAVSVTTPVMATVGATILTFNLTISSATVTFPTGNVFVGGSVLVPTTADPGNYLTISTLTIIYL